MKRAVFYPGMEYPRMGAAAAAGIVRAFDCQCLGDCAKYVLNSCHLHSKCSDCCELDIETDEIEVPAASDSEQELEVAGCLHWQTHG
jgi:hypothetical protein